MKGTSSGQERNSSNAVAVDSRERLWLVGYGTLIALGTAVLVFASRSLGLV